MDGNDKTLNQNLKYTILALKVIKDLEKARNAGIRKLQNKQAKTGSNVTLFTEQTIKKYTINVRSENEETR